MKRVLLEMVVATLAGVLLTVAGISIASAAAKASVHPHGAIASASPASDRSCREDINYNFVDTGTPQGGSTWWVDNTCNWYQRVHIKCWSQLTNQLHNYNGGWVLHGVVDSTNCPDLGQEMVKFGWEFRTTLSSPVTIKWLWTRPGFKPRA